MLSTDMVVSEKTGFFHRVFDDLLHPRAEWNLAERHCRAAAREITFDFKSDLLRGQPHLLNDHEGDPVALPEDGENQMFRPQVVILVAFGLFPGQDDDFPAFIRESFEHPISSRALPVSSRRFMWIS